jgi:signal transduction histidine kinase
MRLLIIVLAIVFLLMILFYNLLLYRRYKKEKQDGLILKGKNLQISHLAVNLEELNRKLVLLNKSKDKFHAIIAHDLRSPIAAFYSIFELLHQSYDSLPDEERKAFIDVAYKEVQRILKLLDNLLTWSRIQGGHLNIRKSDFFIDEAIMEIVSSLKNMAEQKNISIEVDAIEHLKINADKEMIMAVIRNLNTNAIKFTPSGQKIQMGVKTSENIIEVYVQDYGIGIPKSKLDVLFEIDSQVQRIGTNNEPGTGLGLHLCYEFIKLHKGEITVESVEGKGSCFAFKIPCEC